MSEQPVKQTTPGEWIVTTTDQGFVNVSAINPRRSIQKTVAVIGHIELEKENYYVSVDEAEILANAALIAVAKDMLNALIQIQSELMTSKESIDLEMVNEMISQILSKLANEAGEEI